MKPVLLLCLVALAGGTVAVGQEIGTIYSGRSDVPELGTVEFPPGQWSLEFRVSPPVPNPTSRPDYFGFRKVGGTLERLGFRRYSPATAPDQLVHLCDGIMEQLGEGAPKDLVGSAEVGEVVPLRFDPVLSRIKVDEKDISFSFIKVAQKHGPNWICFAHIYSSDGWAFVVFHASPSVLDPYTAQSVSWISRDSTTPPSAGK